MRQSSKEGEALPVFNPSYGRSLPSELPRCFVGEIERETPHFKSTVLLVQHNLALHCMTQSQC